MEAQQGLGALASVLSRDLSQIEDLPTYVTPPPGVYKLMIEDVQQKEINKKTTIVVEYKIVECVALTANDDDFKARLAAIKPTDKMSEAFWFDNAEKIETTVSVLKAKYGGLGVALQTTNLFEIVSRMKGMLVSCQVDNRIDKDDKTKFYPNTKNMVPAV